jgi:hypothetical protein
MQTQCSKQLINLTMNTSGYTFASGERLWLTISVPLNTTIYWDGASNNSRLVTPTIVMPELGLLLLMLAPLVPYFMSAIWRRKRLAGMLMSTLLAVCVIIGLLSISVPSASAAPYYDVSNSNTFWFYDDTTPLQYMMYQSQPSGTLKSQAGSATIYFYSDTWPAGWQVNAGTSTVYFYVQTTGAKTVGFTLYAGTTGSWTSLGNGSWNGNQGSITLVNTSFSTSSYTFSTGERLRLQVDVGNGATFFWESAYNNSRLVIPGITVPENAIVFIAMAVLIPFVVGGSRNRQAFQTWLKRIARLGNGNWRACVLRARRSTKK